MQGTRPDPDSCDPDSWLKRIYENAEERFSDTETGHTIAVIKAVIYGKERDIM